MIKNKIHCIEMRKKGFDDKTLDELSMMVGWVEAPDEEDGKWVVTMSDNCIFVCNTQIEAQTLSGIEEIKAMMMEKEK